MTHTVITGIAIITLITLKESYSIVLFSAIIMFLQFLQRTGKNIYTHKKGNLQMTTQDTVKYHLIPLLPLCTLPSSYFSLLFVPSKIIDDIVLEKKFRAFC